MLTVTVLGPLIANEEAWIAAVSEPGKKLNSKVLDTSEQAITWLLNKLPAGKPVTCDASLSKLAAERGWNVAPLPKPFLQEVSIAVMVEFHDPGFRKITDADIFADLFLAAARFATAQPWRRLDSEPLTLTVSGTTSGTRGAVIAKDDDKFCLSLFQSPAEANRFVELSEEDDDGAFDLDAFTCTLDFEANEVTRLMEQAWGVAFDPLFELLQNGRIQPIRVDDVRLFAAALRALSSVGSTGSSGTGACELLGKRVEVRIEVEAPDVSHPSHPPGPRTHPFNALDAVISPQLYALARSTPGWSDLAEASPDRTLAMMLSLFVQPVGGKTIATRFLEGELPDEWRGWVETARRGRLALCQVESTGAGQVAMFDLLLNESVNVHDRALSRGASLHDVGLLWLVEVDGVTLTAGAADRPLSPRKGLELRDEMKRTTPWTREALCTPKLTEALLTAFRAKLRAQRERTVDALNTDDQPLAFGVDQYSLRGRPEALAERIGLQPDATHHEEFSFSVTKRGNAVHATWWSTLLFELDLGDRALFVKANSLARLDFARKWLARVLGDRVTFVERRLDTAPVPDYGERIDLQPVLPGPWVAVLPTVELRAGLPSFEELRTNEKARREAHLTIVRHERDGSTDVATFDLRRRVGLSARGEWIGPDTLWLAMGAGVPISLVLQSVVAPLFTDLEGDELTRVSDGVRLAWAAWLVAKQGGSMQQAVAAARQRLTPSSDAALSPGGSLSPELPRHSPNLAQVLEALPWAIQRVQTFFPEDQRVVKEVRIERLELSISCEAFWASDDALTKTLAPLGYQPGDAPCDDFEDLSPEADFEWRVTPPAWRWELAADYVRALTKFGTGLDARVDAHVKLMDRLLIERNEALRSAWQDLQASSPHTVTSLLLMLFEQSPELVEAGKLAEAIAIAEQRILERS